MGIILQLKWIFINIKDLAFIYITKCLVVIITVILFLSIPTFIFAEKYFDTSLYVEYTFDDNGLCKVSEEYSIKNNTTEKYLPSFEYEIHNTDLSNIEVISDGTGIPYNISNNDTSTLLKINFNDKVLGKDRVRKLIINYTVTNYAKRAGNVWEISIPDHDNLSEISGIRKRLIVPKSYGMEAYISPYYEEKLESSKYLYYIFNKEALKTSRIIAGFGEYQIFDFNITYNLENNKSFSSIEKIPVPPDTEYQRVFLQSFTPKPGNIEVDEDGNWLATYKLNAKEKSKVTINGYVQLYANPRRYLVPPISNLYQNIKSTKYWPSENSDIVELTKKYPSVEDKYRFVLDTLNYDVSLTDQEQRIGALQSLKINKDVSCREYSDLLITLLRASGIPAREIVGYAYTDNNDLKSVTFFKDILHSWVQYWNYDSKMWISVDPAWGDTSNTDYFNKFDLKHFTFTIHGKDDTMPLSPGFYGNDNNEKELLISFGMAKNNLNEKPLSINIKNNSFFAFNRNTSIIVENQNEYAIYDKKLKVLSDKQKFLLEDSIEVIPPYSEIVMNFHTPFSILGARIPNQLSIFLNDKEYLLNSHKKIDMYTQLIIIFLIFLLLSFLIYSRIRKYDKDKK